MVMVMMMMTMTSDPDPDLASDGHTTAYTPDPTGQQPTTHTPTRRQDVPPTRPAQTSTCTARGPAPTPSPSPAGDRTGAATTLTATHSGGLPHASQPQDDRRAHSVPPRYPPYSWLSPTLPAVLLSPG